MPPCRARTRALEERADDAAAIVRGRLRRSSAAAREAELSPPSARERNIGFIEEMISNDAMFPSSMERE